MFDSLADQIKHDEQLQNSNNERLGRWLATALASVVLFGGLYCCIQLLQ